MKRANGLALFASLFTILQWRPSMACNDLWKPASATFYGGSDASDTMGGACGYGNLYTDGYNELNAALSTALFKDGATCGACYKIKCDATKTGWCKYWDKYVTVTATNYCPPNYDEDDNAGGWCNHDREHFDMSQPGWEVIGVYRAGIIPVLYQRVPCKRTGGIRMEINGNPYFELVLFTNVGGSGLIIAVWIKGSETDWLPCSRNWGMNWQNGNYLNYQDLSFRIQTDDMKMLTIYDVAPLSWWFGTAYPTMLNF